MTDGRREQCLQIVNDAISELQTLAADLYTGSEDFDGMRAFAESAGNMAGAAFEILDEADGESGDNSEDADGQQGAGEN